MARQNGQDPRCGGQTTVTQRPSHTLNPGHWQLPPIQKVSRSIVPPFALYLHEARPDSSPLLWLLVSVEEVRELWDAHLFESGLVVDELDDPAGVYQEPVSATITGTMWEGCWSLLTCRRARQGTKERCVS